MSHRYPLRFKPFSDSFYHKFLQRPYHINYVEQGLAIPFWETGIQFFALNSCWQIDEFNRKRSGLHVEAVANAIKYAQKQEIDARKTGQLAADNIQRAGDRPRPAVSQSAYTLPAQTRRAVEWLV